MGDKNKQRYTEGVTEEGNVVIVDDRLRYGLGSLVIAAAIGATAGGFAYDKYKSTKGKRAEECDVQLLPLRNVALYAPQDGLVSKLLDAKDVSSLMATLNDIDISLSKKTNEHASLPLSDIVNYDSAGELMGRLFYASTPEELINTAVEIDKQLTAKKGGSTDTTSSDYSPENTYLPEYIVDNWVDRPLEVPGSVSRTLVRFYHKALAYEWYLTLFYPNSSTQASPRLSSEGKASILPLRNHVDKLMYVDTFLASEKVDHLDRLLNLTDPIAFATSFSNFGYGALAEYVVPKNYYINAYVNQDLSLILSARYESEIQDLFAEDSGI